MSCFAGLAQLLRNKPNFNILKMPFYAVAKGKTVGIYETWSECEVNVKGFAGAKYKKFNTQSDASEFIKNNSGDLTAKHTTSLKFAQKRKCTENDTTGTSKRTRLINIEDLMRDLNNDFIKDEDGFVQVYTDGACSSNGKNAAKAGIGVYFGENHILNVSQPVSGRATNNCGEIQAATKAILNAHEAGVRKLCINTDSKFLINSAEKWMTGWRKNNWQLKSGGPVKNKSDFQALYSAQKLLEVKYNYVTAHNGVFGNEKADALAKAGAEKYSLITNM